MSVGPPSETASLSMHSKSFAGTTPASSLYDITGGGNESQTMKGMLKGPTEVLILRISAEIYSIEVISDVFEKGPLKGILDEFVAPVKMPFIPPRSVPSASGASGLPTAIGAATAPAFQLGGTMGGTGGLLSTRMTPSLSARSSSPTGSEDSKHSLSLKNRPVGISERQYEVRDIVNGVLTNIFKDVLNSRDTKEQVTIPFPTHPLHPDSPSCSWSEPLRSLFVG